MKLTDEQNASQANLQRAIEQHIRVHSDSATPELVVDWAAIVEVVSYDDEGDRCVGYHLIFAGGEMSDHRALGLYEQGSHLVRHGQRYGEIDDA